MGLQDALVMSAVPAHDVIKSRCDSAMSVTSSKGRPASMEPDMRDAKLNGDNNSGETAYNNNNSCETAHNSVIDQTDLNYDVNDDEDIYDDTGDDSDWETDESRLSRALHSWMPDYVITPLPRQGHTAREPVFSARLGRETNIRRAESTESINTQLSLFSCSSHGSKKTREKRRRRVRRKKPTSAERRQKRNSASTSSGSRWVELAKKRKGELDRFMMAQAHTLMMGINFTDESEAFQLCDADERKALFRCGTLDKLAFAANLKKSDSMTNLRDDTKPKPRQRTSSADAKTFFGKPIDFHELQRQMMNQRLFALTSTHRRSSGRRPLGHRSHSRQSLTSVGSCDVFYSVNTPRTNTPPGLAPGSAKSGGERGKERVSMWKGDTEILAIDLKKELTSNVKQRIAVTTTALERVTGMGDDNEQRPYTCHLPEFPAFIDDDFALQPKISQKIRISPHLSDVIKSDIRVRMGRPRYHEIRVQDVEMWTRGQTLDRAHQNLKVFNWLHSLKEDEFDLVSLQQDINDVPPDVDDVTFGDMVLIRAVDEPDVKPLFQHKKTYVKLVKIGK